ncbi:cytochrome P450 monooxygenase-like protein [Delitschia confertaspora ATCC 74209]|uniref:Cytochrome P450 monooxygenase-like protein n=1 Tax=Delitschia confertaspora ATCC 74209 TaxID=1513339 RepID=A0A9P4JVS9_9PLEO|nr:cytochrome P450 monooxygenase-like protein [Delitschia confertaspora ATCC 74209]
MSLYILLLSLRNISFTSAIAFVFTVLTLSFLLKVLYRLTLHPLSSFPGPLLSRSTHLPFLYNSYLGNVVDYVAALHRQYGPLVRIHPNELSFIHPQAWKDVHGHPSPHHPIPSKILDPNNAPPGDATSLQFVPGDEEHRELRKVFAPAFADRAVKKQEKVVFAKYADLLVEKLREGVQPDPGKGKVVDMVQMYNFTTFDIMGNLAFGEPLDMLNSGVYTPWVRTIFQHIRLGARLHLLAHYPVLRRIVAFLFLRGLYEKREAMYRFVVRSVTRRLDKRGDEHPDIFNLILKLEGERQLTRAEMDANASLFMIAGSETTATLLSGLTYFLLKHPGKMQRLVDEIRGAFQSSADINMKELAQLPYLHACMEETFRCYPPVPIGLPRITGEQWSTICGVYVPPRTNLSVWQYPMFTSPDYFKDPLSFIPERWTGEDPQFDNDVKSVLQPFSFGPRNCLGKNMAYHELRLIIAKVLYNFDLELCLEGSNWLDQPVYILWEKKPLMVKLRPVENW